MASQTVLIADDEPHLIRILSYNLKKSGFMVETANDGVACIEKATSLLPALIVSDFQMPLLNGLQACIRLRADPRTATIPVLMLTARGHRITAIELAQTNIRAVLPKPFSTRQLLATIEQILGTQGAGVTAA